MQPPAAPRRADRRRAPVVVYWRVTPRRCGLAPRFPYLMPGLPAPELVLAYDFRPDVASL